jgi:hypothetical protein
MFPFLGSRNPPCHSHSNSWLTVHSTLEVFWNCLLLLLVMSSNNLSSVCYLLCLVMHTLELSLSYGRRSVDQFVLVSGSPLGPMSRFCPYPFSSRNCFVVLPAGRPLWREDGSVACSADWSGHWGPITIHYRLIWDCIPSSSPLTTRRDYDGSILTCLHTGFRGSYSGHVLWSCSWSWS